VQKTYINGQSAELKFKYNPNIMFVYPVTEDELNQVVINYKVNLQLDLIKYLNF